MLDVYMRQFVLPNIKIGYIYFLYIFTQDLIADILHSSTGVLYSLIVNRSVIAKAS